MGDDRTLSERLDELEREGRELAARRERCDTLQAELEQATTSFTEQATLVDGLRADLQTAMDVMFPAGGRRVRQS